MAIDNSTNELEATRTDLDSLDLCSFSVPGGFLWALCKYLTISTAVSILMLVPIGGVYAALSTLFGMDDSNVFLIGILLAVPFTFWFCSDYLIYRVGVGQNGIELGHELFGRLIEFEEVTFLSGEPRRDELGQFYPQLVLETGRRRHVIKMRQNEVTSCFERLRPLCVRAAAVSPQSEEFAAPHPDARIRGDARLIAHRLRSMTVAWLASLFAIAYGGFLWYAFVVNANGAGFGLLLLPGSVMGLLYAVAQTKRYSELRVKWLMKSTALTEGFISSFKERTEAAWRCAHIDPVIIGLQFQAGTRWNPGLTDGQIELFENHFFRPDPRRLQAVSQTCEWYRQREDRCPGLVRRTARNGPRCLRIPERCRDNGRSNRMHCRGPLRGAA